MHQRARIRSAMSGILAAGVEVGGRVDFGRVNPLDLPEIPALMFYFAGESADVRSGDRWCVDSYERELTVNVEVVSADGVDHVDTLCEQVEAALAADQTLDGEASAIQMTTTIPYEINTESETALYAARIAFRVIYVTELHDGIKSDVFDGGDFTIDRPEGGAYPVLSAGKVDV